ncbi:MAG: flagellar type III secretion system pore protein FliP [Myxococcota bacterium]
MISRLPNWMTRLPLVMVTLGAALALIGLSADEAMAQAAAALDAAESTSPSGIRIELTNASEGGSYVAGLKLMLLMVAMTFAPAIVLSMTSFTRIIVVLALLRQAVGVVQLPPSRVLVGLAMFLTLFTMAPVMKQIDTVAVQPYQAGKINEKEALEAALVPARKFMLRHTRESDLSMFLTMMKAERPRTAADVPTVAVVPAFMLSELKTAFQAGALLFIPFLVIDIVVASVLMSMGMMMLPPATISLPLKLIVFVLVDGWALVITSLAASFVG